jgi:hypothetical protein
VSLYAPIKMCWPLSKVASDPSGKDTFKALARPPAARAASKTVAW